MCIFIQFLCIMSAMKHAMSQHATQARTTFFIFFSKKLCSKETMTHSLYSIIGSYCFRNTSLHPSILFIC